MRTRMFSLVLVLIGLHAAAPAPAAESTRTLSLQLPAELSGPFAVENLAGTMRVVPGSGNQVTAVATVHAESEELAGLVRFERVQGEHGEPSLRVRYPLERYPTIRYPAGSAAGSFLGMFLGSQNRTKYDGYKVRISDREGALIYADVEVRIPPRAVTATFRNVAGLLHGEKVEGQLTFDSGSADITLEQLRGELVADTGSGDVKAADLEGSFTCDTGSGDCELTGFRGQRIVCDTGSGDITARSVGAESFAADAGSGDILVEKADLMQFEADTGSGQIELQARAERLTRISADTGSGDVTLRLGPDASFEAHMDTGSGDVDSGYPDAEPMREDGELIGYRRGGGQIRIDVDTGSGDLSLRP